MFGSRNFGTGMLSKGLCDIAYLILCRQTLLGLPTVFAIALPCVLSNRLVLNVRAAHQMLTTSGIPQPVSTIKFR